MQSKTLSSFPKTAALTAYSWNKSKVNPTPRSQGSDKRAHASITSRGPAKPLGGLGMFPQSSQSSQNGGGTRSKLPFSFPESRAAPPTRPGQAEFDAGASPMQHAIARLHLENEQLRNHISTSIIRLLRIGQLYNECIKLSKSLLMKRQKMSMNQGFKKSLLFEILESKQSVTPRDVISKCHDSQTQAIQTMYNTFKMWRERERSESHRESQKILQVPLQEFLGFTILQIVALLQIRNDRDEVLNREWQLKQGEIFKLQDKLKLISLAVARVLIRIQKFLKIYFESYGLAPAGP
jgi:hypothetical protein